MKTPKIEIEIEYGKTLRDEFAMAALTGLLASPGEAFLGVDGFCELAYRYADGMLNVRKTQ